MKLRREFTGQVSADDATARAEKLLRMMRYKKAPCATHLKFVRGAPYSSLYSCRPRSFESFIHLWIEGHGPESTKVTIEQEVTRVFQPPHRLAKLFFEGEIADIQEGILTNIPPAVNRVKENKMAGTAHLVYLLASAGIAYAIATLISGFVMWEFIIAWTTVILAMIYFADRWPFQLIEFKVRHPKGAKIIPDPEPEKDPAEGSGMDGQKAKAKAGTKVL